MHQFIITIMTIIIPMFRTRAGRRLLDAQLVSPFPHALMVWNKMEPCVSLSAKRASTVSAPYAGRTARRITTRDSLTMAPTATSQMLMAEVLDKCTSSPVVNNGAKAPFGTPSATITSTVSVAASAHPIARLA